jgi:hypothetical protein
MQGLLENFPSLPRRLFKSLIKKELLGGLSLPGLQDCPDEIFFWTSFLSPLCYNFEREKVTRRQSLLERLRLSKREIWR